MSFVLMMMESVNQLALHCVPGFLLSFLTRSFWFSISSSQQHNKTPKMQFHCKDPFFKEKKRRLYEKPEKKREGCMRSQMQTKAECEAAKCSFSGNGKKGGDVYQGGQLANHAN